MWVRKKNHPITNKPLYLFRDCVAGSGARRWWVGTDPRATPCRGYMHAYASPDAVSPLRLTQWHVCKDGRFLPVPSLRIHSVDVGGEAPQKQPVGVTKTAKRRVEGEEIEGHVPKKKAKKKKKKAKQKASVANSKVPVTWRGTGEGCCIVL